MGKEMIDKLNSERLKEIGRSPAYPIMTNNKSYSGMTLREYIATQAMAGLLSRASGYNEETISDISVKQADSLIRALHINDLIK